MASFDLWMAGRNTVLVQELNYNPPPALLSWRLLASQIGVTAYVVMSSNSQVCDVPFLWGECLFIPNSHLSTPCSSICPGRKLCDKSLLATVDGLMVGNWAKLSSWCLTPHFGTELGGGNPSWSHQSPSSGLTLSALNTLLWKLSIINKAKRIL